MPLLGARSTRTWSVYNPDTGLWMDGRGTRRPMSYRDMILWEWPNGDAPLTALTSQLKKEKVTDPHFHWFRQDYISQAGAVAGLFSNVALTTAYAGGGVMGTPLYVQVSQAVLEQFRVGHTVVLKDTTDPRVFGVAEVRGTTPNGASSFLAVRLLGPDPAVTGATWDLQGVNRLMVSGNINAENAAIPSAVTYDPTMYENYTQIFRTPLELSRTAEETEIRGGPAYQDLQRQILKFHSIEIEKALLWSIPSVTMVGNMPMRSTGGLFHFAANYGQTFDYATDATVTPGTTWVAGGAAWLENALAQIFRFGSKERVAFCGEGVLIGISQLVRTANMTSFEITATTEEFGIQVHKWRTPFGTVNFKTHPLFFDSGDYNTALIFDLADSQWRYVHDTDFFKDDPKANTGHGRVDGRKEEYLTEAGIQWGHPTWQAVLFNFGVDNPTP